MNIKTLIVIFAVFIGAAGILLVSMSRATLEIMNRDEREGRLRVEPVFFEDKIIYKLPQTNMLPNNVFYSFKEIRDWLWIKFSVGKEREAKIMLILADKRIAEARTLANKGKYNIALETGMKAVDKLKYANELVGEMRNQDTAGKQIIIQIMDSTLAYSEIIREIGQKDGVNNQKYLLLQKYIDDFKEEQIKKEEPSSN
ncbi:TPA: hypothetical protein DD455_04810 [Candidatus Shapirobacteria bacterium]|nr:hypothetical protein [Candidatus Shapirobacteria bacterium]